MLHNWLVKFGKKQHTANMQHAGKMTGFSSFLIQGASYLVLALYIAG